ncbi:transcription factor MafK-like isoform X1 [Portunus trituberculatus]|uniref:transcription factor MafK-like isoform X1 n=1 Tax=Portunus trituberculatus TaxID=210409 RepID=UPI001E1CBF6B|nr:transcription factor MafK-like isoform X1 [Portunus trituberculatus]
MGLAVGLAAVRGRGQSTVGRPGRSDSVNNHLSDSALLLFPPLPAARFSASPPHAAVAPSLRYTRLLLQGWKGDPSRALSWQALTRTLHSGKTGCRIKRIEQKDELESERTTEQVDIEKLANDNISMRTEIDRLYQNYEALKKFANLKNIPLPQDLETL